MKQALTSISLILILSVTVVVTADAVTPDAEHGMHHKKMNDDRIPLNLSPAMEQHQLLNMRAHLQAVQKIIDLIRHEKFAKASTIAHEQLGLTPEMKQMCSRFENDEFKAMGFAFHESGDALSDALKTGDAGASLSALSNTLQFCVSCHARFKQ